MLQKTNIPVSFAQGLNLKVDPKQLVVGQMLTLENAIFTTPGMLRKRNGYTAFPQTILTGGSIASGAALASFKDELLAFDGNFLYSYDVSNTVWVNKGRSPGLQVELNNVVKNGNLLVRQDMAQHSTGLQLFTWEDEISGNGFSYLIRDSVTKVVLTEIVGINGGNAQLVKPLVIGNFFVIIFSASSGSTLSMISIPVATPLSPSSTSVIFTGAGITAWDGTFLGTSLYISVANGALSTFTISSSLVVGTPVTVATPADHVAVYADITLSQLWVMYQQNSEIDYTVYSSALTTVLAPTMVDTLVNSAQQLIVYADNGVGHGFYSEEPSSSLSYFIRTFTGTNTGTITGPSDFKRSVSIASKIFQYNGGVYFLANFSTPQQPTYFLLTLDGSIVAKVLPLAGGGIIGSPMIPEAIQIIPGAVMIAVLQVDQLETVATTIATYTGVVMLTIDFTSADTYYKASIANTLQVTGGMLNTYDGLNYNETGFNVYPEEITNTNSITGGNLGNASVATQYQYSVTYTWYDNNGQVENSFPSIPDANTTVNFAMGVVTGSVILTIPTLRLTEKQDVQINVYRTEGNGTIFYQLTNHVNGIGFYNDPTVDTLTFTDAVPDTAAIGFPILYTTGNVVGNDGPPAPKLITQYINRLMLVPSENPLQIWFSEEVVPGTALNFSALFTVNVDARGGAITALQQMDNYLIIFKENTIFYLTGQGPDSTGAQNDFINATLITTDSGCSTAHSIVQTPVGIMYQTPKGIYLLQRTLQPEYIGAPVEAFNQYPVTSAQLIPTTNQVRFTLETAQTTLVYDYYIKQWSVFTNQDAQDSALYTQQMTYIQPNGLVLTEAPGIFTDNGSFIPLRLTTSWLSFAQLQGFQRAYRGLILGEYKSPHTLSVGVAYDFDSTVVQTDLIDTTLASTEEPYEWRVDFRRQKCTAIQFTIQDIQTSSFGEGLSISAINLMIGAKAGTNKLSQPRIYS